jgi:hypothetical protein
MLNTQAQNNMSSFNLTNNKFIPNLINKQINYDQSSTSPLLTSANQQNVNAPKYFNNQ